MRKALVNLGLAAASVLVALALAEIALRVTGFSYPVFFNADPVTGISHRPDVAGWYREEGEAFVRISPQGLRDRPHEPAKPADTFRIAVLGDSYAEALQVPLERTFWRSLEERANACGASGGRRVEVINFGASGFGTAQELLTLRDRVWPYAPDLVLLAFVTGNDVRDNSKALSRSYPRPYFDRALGLDESFRTDPAYRIRDSRFLRALAAASDYSRLVQLLFLAQNRLKQRAEQRGGAGSAEAGLDAEVYEAPRSEAWQEAWAITEALITTMAAEVKAKGAELMIVTLSNGIQVHPDPAVRKAFADRIGVTDLFYPDRRIAELAKRLHVDSVILALRLAQVAEHEKVFLHGFENAQLGGGHWNEEGHRRAAEIIAEAICGAAVGTKNKAGPIGPAFDY